MYLEILRCVSDKIDKSLHRDAVHWRRQNICPPCLYKIVDEPSLKFSLLCAMDGNNSLKLIDPLYRSGHALPDGRGLESPIWISAEEVDVFKDEVSNNKKVRTVIDHQAVNQSFSL